MSEYLTYCTPTGPDAIHRWANGARSGSLCFCKQSKIDGDEPGDVPLPIRDGMPLQEAKDALARAAFGMTTAEAMKQGICARCHQPPTFYSPAGRSEYRISGQCEPCFDEVCKDPDDENEADTRTTVEKGDPGEHGDDQ